MFRLDRTAVLARLQIAAAQLLATRPDVVEVRLFGSLARDEAGPGSDADLLVLVDHCDAPFVERSHTFSSAFGDVGVGCDVLVHTVPEWETLRTHGSRFLAEVGTNGIVLARR